MTTVPAWPKSCRKGWTTGQEAGSSFQPRSSALPTSPQLREPEDKSKQNRSQQHPGRSPQSLVGISHMIYLLHLGGGRNEGAPLCGNLPLQRGLGPWRAAGFPPWLSSCFVPELFSPGTRPTITQLALGTGGTLPCPGRRCTFRKIQTTCIKRPLQTLPSSCILPCTLGNASSTWEGNDTAVNG